MTDKSAWEKYFDGHAPRYLENCFTKNTTAEIEFLLDVLPLTPGARILDIGCGAGRHAVALAKRGFQVTGADLSAGMLAEAEKAAQAAGVQVEWIQVDAARFQATAPYDAAICLCEGAFCLLGAEDDPWTHDLAILRNIHAALRPEAPFLMTTLNACRRIREANADAVAAGRFDPQTLTTQSEIEWDTAAGKQSAVVRERAYVPTELALMLRLAGFSVEHLWGGTAGNWGRRPLDLDEMEIMVVARKAFQPAPLP